jgi:hypothetical protein
MVTIYLTKWRDLVKSYRLLREGVDLWRERWLLLGGMVEPQMLSEYIYQPFPASRIWDKRRFARGTFIEVPIVRDGRESWAIFHDQ